MYPYLEQDLLAGMAWVMSKFLMTTYEDQSISGIFPVVNGKVDSAAGFPFADSDGLFYIETIPLPESKYASTGMLGYKLWHKKTGPLLTSINQKG
jgi:hypothetical protein